jgi:hypothetical protein
MADPTDSVAELIREVSRTRDEIMRADSARLEKIAAKADKGELDRLSEHVAKQVSDLQRAVNSLSLKLGRPGGSALGEFSAGADQAAARGLCELKHFLRVPRADAAYPFAPSHDDVSEASLAIRAMRRLLKTTSLDTLDAMERKA